MKAYELMAIIATMPCDTNIHIVTNDGKIIGVDDIVYVEEDRSVQIHAE